MKKKLDTKMLKTVKGGTFGCYTPCSPCGGKRGGKSC